jgi:catechol 1,2-dioxygenase
MLVYENPIVLKFRKVKYLQPVAKGLTAPDMMGPEIKLGAPTRTYSLIEDPETEKMPRVIMRGSVKYSDNTPITNAKLNIWHPDYHGAYSLFGYDCRGIIQVDKNGNYEFEACVPGCLTLQSLLGRKLPSFLKDKFVRPGHFHVKLDYGNKFFVTQIYTTSMYMKEDNVKKGFGLDPLYDNLIKFEKAKDKDHYEGRFDFVLPK